MFEKLYLEFGGKLFDDNHFSRCCPGFEPDTKIKMLTSMSDKVEVIISILADDIESGRRRQDLNMSYANNISHLVDSFKQVGLDVNSVVINKYNGQPGAKAFKRKLEHVGIITYLFHKIDGYPSNIDHVLSENGYGKNPFIKTTKPIVLITGPGAGSGKMSVAFSQLFNETQSGNKNVGFAKFETLPVWNLSLRHPINIAYEASTVNINDVNMIDHYHFEKYGVFAVNYSRDIEAFPLLQATFKRIGKDIYHSPTDMGVNMVGFCIDDEEAAIRASKEEVIRRYFETLCYYKQGKVEETAVFRINTLMEKLGLRRTDRAVVIPTLKQQEKTGRNSASIQLPTGEIISASENGLTSASSELLLKTLQKQLGLNAKIKLLPDNIMKKTIELKSGILGDKKFLLSIGEVLLLLASSSITNELSSHAVEQLASLTGSEAHITYMISEEEERVWKKLGVTITKEPHRRLQSHIAN